MDQNGHCSRSREAREDAAAVVVDGFAEEVALVREDAGGGDLDRLAAYPTLMKTHRRCGTTYASPTSPRSHRPPAEMVSSGGNTSQAPRSVDPHGDRSMHLDAPA